MKIFEIQTTAWEEDNFFIATDLTQEQIDLVIAPMVIKERDGDSIYTNNQYVDALWKAYPQNLVIYNESITLIEY